MEIVGYKAFNKDHTNRYGFLFEESKLYEINGEVKFGNNGNGFHFCERFEDTLRYFDGKSDNISFAKVIGTGTIKEYCDDYFGYYDMYVCSNLEVISFLNKEDILKEIDKKIEEVCFYPQGLYRIIQGLNLSKDEITYISQKVRTNCNFFEKAIEYYQFNNSNVYEKK